MLPRWIALAVMIAGHATAVVADVRGTDEFGAPVILRDDGSWDYLDDVAEIVLSAEDVGLVDVDVTEDPQRNLNRANFGAHSRMALVSLVGNRLDSRRRIFIRFDENRVLDLMPPGARVVLELHGERWQGPPNAAALVYRVLEPWSEGRGRPSAGRPVPIARPGEISGVTQPEIGYRRAWGRMPLSAPRGPYTVDITELVRSWDRGRVPNFGLALIVEDEDYASYSYAFHSSESENPALRPRLIVLPPADVDPPRRPVGL